MGCGASTLPVDATDKSINKKNKFYFYYFSEPVKEIVKEEVKKKEEAKKEEDKKDERVPIKKDDAKVEIKKEEINKVEVQTVEPKKEESKVDEIIKDNKEAIKEIVVAEISKPEEGGKPK